MDPNVWGPHAWQFLHSITLAYPDNPTDNDKQHHSQFFDSLKNILPCDKCKNHFTHNLETYPIENHLENKESLFRWLVDIHNRVNVINNKREYSYDEVTEIYEKMYGKSDNGLFINNQWLYVIFVFLLLCLTFYYIRK
jgi:hypothetical protein